MAHWALDKQPWQKQMTGMAAELAYYISDKYTIHTWLFWLGPVMDQDRLSQIELLTLLSCLISCSSLLESAALKDQLQHPTFLLVLHVRCFFRQMAGRFETVWKIG